MAARSFARRKTLHILGSFAGLILLPLWLWAVRAPDAAYAPLPDYDIRGGYSGLLGLDDPRLAGEVARLRQQRGAKLAPAGEKWETRTARPEAAEIAKAFGEEVSLQWNENGTVASLTAGERPLAAPQPGLDPEAAARQFLRAHQLLLGLDEATLASLQAVPREDSAVEGEAVVFRQTIAGLPVYQAELKVSLGSDNAVEAVAGTVYPALSVSPRARLSAAEAAVQAAGYVDSSARERPGRLRSARKAAESASASGWVHKPAEPLGLGPNGEFVPTLIARQEGPEEIAPWKPLQVPA